MRNRTGRGLVLGTPGGFGRCCSAVNNQKDSGHEATPNQKTSAGCYRKFIPASAEIAAPLTYLTKDEKNHMTWGALHEAAFQKL